MVALHDDEIAVGVAQLGLGQHHGAVATLVDVE